MVGHEQNRGIDKKTYAHDCGEGTDPAVGKKAIASENQAQECRKGRYDKPGLRRNVLGLRVARDQRVDALDLRFVRIAARQAMTEIGQAGGTEPLAAMLARTDGVMVLVVEAAHMFPRRPEP